jgi:hypothetical protein
MNQQPQTDSHGASANRRKRGTARTDLLGTTIRAVWRLFETTRPFGSRLSPELIELRLPLGTEFAALDVADQLLPPMAVVEKMIVDLPLLGDSEVDESLGWLIAVSNT